MLLGGFGFLSRLHGLSADALVEAEVVLADGSIVIVNEKEHEGEAKLRLDSTVTSATQPTSQTCGGPFAALVLHSVLLRGTKRERIQSQLSSRVILFSECL